MEVLVFGCSERDKKEDIYFPLVRSIKQNTYILSKSGKCKN